VITAELYSSVLYNHSLNSSVSWLIVLNAIAGHKARIMIYNAHTT